MDNSLPIGIFDSGVGGLTVARAIIDQLPNESVKYIGDSKHSPYGDKSIEQVRDLSLSVMDKLVSGGVKMLVIACNSASSAVYDIAKQKYELQLGIPVVEVIYPAVRSAMAVTKNNHIGVIGTKATVESDSYIHAFKNHYNYSCETKIYTASCPEFVSYVEQGVTCGVDLLELAHKYLEPIKNANVDTLVLGCTHYPLLSGVISYVMGPEVRLVSSADETAKDVYRILHEERLLRESDEPASYEFFTSGDSVQFEKLARRFLGPEVKFVEHIS